MQGYICRYTNKSNQYIQDMIRNYAEKYNDLIDFDKYYNYIWGEKLSYNGRDKCKLHDEQNGESFSYKRESKFWSCFGACHVNAGGIMEYHLRFLRKEKSFVTEIDALRDLYRIYPYLPKPEFHNKHSDISIYNNMYNSSLKTVKTKLNILKECNLNSKITPTVTQYNISNIESFDKLVFTCFTRKYLDMMDKVENINKI